MARSASAKKPLRLKDELAELERYLITCKDHGTKSLAALRDAEPPRAAPNGADGGRVAQLEAQLAALQAENTALATQARTGPAAAAAQQHAASAEALNTLKAKCARLESELAASRTTAALSAPRAAPRPATASGGAAVDPAALHAMQAAIAQLKQDRQALEDTVVTMYEDLFKDELISGLVGVVRRKENELVAALDAPGGGAAAGKRNGLGKPTPRLKARLDDATERIERLEKELKAKASEMDAAERHAADMLKIATVESSAQADHYKSAWKREQERRKTLHQKVLELKGAIRVFCRVRPLTRGDGDTENSVLVRDQESLLINIPQVEERRRAASAPLHASSRASPSPRLVGRDFTYDFDRVFGPNDDQEAVYEDVSDLIVSVADGYNVCILAYGQTGSGKTYTMQGTRANPGINMRALRELFQVGEDRRESVRMQVQASIVEIYNDSIFDLLSEVPRNTGDKLDIKEVGGHIWIPNLVMQKVSSVADVERLIAKGDTGRSTFATDMNEHSSRSHLILSLYVRTDNAISGEKTASKLHLIDLAGSERVSRSNAEGARLTEAQKINTSLSALGDVIQSLKAQSAHVPYRNCKLTRLLSDSLGGKSKTLLVVNLSPTRESAPESRCSCEFASRAKKVELGRAIRNVDAAIEKGALPVRPASMGASGRARRTMTTPELGRVRAAR